MPLRSSVLAALLALLVAPAVLAQPREPIVRVHVLNRVAPQAVTVQADESPLALYADRAGAPVATLQPGQSATVARTGGRLRLDAPTATREAAVFEAVPAEGAALALRTGSHRKRYRGALSVELDGGRRALRLVNYVPVEAYVASVVASEYPFTEIEGVKAQAVLARTYALRARDHAEGAAPFDVTDDTGSQVYRGADAETDVSRAATAQTRGEVLLYRGALAEATYYSCSGGHTADNESVWRGNPVPYLRGRPDPYDADCPDHRWTTTASAGGVLRALASRYGGSVTGIEVVSRSPDGRVTAVRLLGSGRTIGGNEFRTAVNGAFGARTVRSTHFTVERSGGTYRFSGRGFGHGVGMSQYGARGQARQGRSYRDVLAFYFAGTDVQPLGDGYDAPPAMVAYEPVSPRARQRAADANPGSEAAAPTRRTAW
jgi:stage II sporulation protein D